MKKSVKALLIFTIIGSLLAGCGGKDKGNETAANTLEKVKQEKKIKIGLEDTYPPMEFRNEKNELVGFDVDLANAIGEKLGVETEYVITEFGGLTMALNSGKFDMSLSAISVNPDRAKEVDFSEPYVKGGQAIIVKNDNTDITKVEDLNDKTVGVQLGTTGEEAAKKIQGLKEVKTYDKATQPFQDLEIGRIQAVIVDEFVGRYYLAKQEGKFKVAVTLDEEPIAIAFKKGDKELQEEVKKAIEELKQDGTMSELSKKWFGEDIYKK
ncbi:ABC transporter substrate-binding protein [Clostridium sp. MSJ-11]|uniref:ABC transporter substrate-binding protein n=1 Tax=Clostridium mobile TaxID=2841512 RepID=A0ABS6EF53_9CLOT|nr:ABC transporter substrate-binding protein [Clostridium mobile]MBU5483843.1 ABC transporter substrate-binding protein [Clostridium mobile]